MDAHQHVGARTTAREGPFWWDACCLGQKRSCNALAVGAFLDFKIYTRKIKLLHCPNDKNKKRLPGICRDDAEDM